MAAPAPTTTTPEPTTTADTTSTATAAPTATAAVGSEIKVGDLARHAGGHDGFTVFVVVRILPLDACEKVLMATVVRLGYFYEAHGFLPMTDNVSMSAMLVRRAANPFGNPFDQIQLDWLERVDRDSLVDRRSTA